jgi:hypothetical protein
MITIHSLLEVGNDLVLIEDFTGPVRDEDYIDGAIELIVGDQPVLSREQVDLVDQLWSYLIEGLEEILAGREFSTGYPDMPVRVVLRPNDKRVAIEVDAGERVAEATVTIDELRTAMLTAGTTFFERLRPHLTRTQHRCDRQLARLAALSRSAQQMPE